MSTESRIPGGVKIEQEIVDAIRAAKHKLRFDRVVQRLSGDLKANLASAVPDCQSVVFAVTAPIKNPAKTAKVMEELVRAGITDTEVRKTIHGNRVLVRSIVHLPKHMPRVIIFVHNSDCDARAILNVAESFLRRRR